MKSTIALLALAQAANAGVVSLEWNASTSSNVAGYKVYWGPSESDPASLNPTGLDVGSALTATTPDLEQRKYCFTARAYSYSSAGEYLESSNSNVVCEDFTPPKVCPCNVFGDAVPDNPSANDSAPVELGMRFRVTRDGYIVGARFYKGSGNGGNHNASLWSITGQRLRYLRFPNETPSGWQQLTFVNPLKVKTGEIYTVSYSAPKGHYAYTYEYFDSTMSGDPIAPLSSSEMPNGVYRYWTSTGGVVPPTDTYRSTNYWVDPVFKEQQ